MIMESVQTGDVEPLDAVKLRCKRGAVHNCKARNVTGQFLPARGL